jgi:hypothetical protein
MSESSKDSWKDWQIKRIEAEAWFGLANEEQAAIKAVMESYRNASTVAELEQLEAGLSEYQRAAIKKMMNREQEIRDRSDADMDE